MRFAQRIREEESGQTLVEFALVLILVSVIAVVLLTQIGQEIPHIFSQINDGFQAAL